MAIEHDLILTWTGGAGGVTPISSTVAHAAAGEANIDDVVPAASTDKEYDLAITKASLQSLYILSAGPLTIKVNNATTPDETWVLAAGVPFLWLADWAAWFPNPLAANVTKIFVTTTTAAKLQVRAIS